MPVSSHIMLQNITLIRYILTLFLLLSLATIITLPLGLDEAYYWYWAKHPDLSYLDHPPMVAWIMAVFINLGGDSEFFVRCGGLLVLCGGLSASFATARLLFPKAPWFAWEYLLVLNLTIIIPGATMIQTPDTPLLAAWQLALYYMAQVVVQQKRQAWYGLGIAVGLGLLSKYTMVLFIPGLLLFLLLSPNHRYWFIRPEPWLAAGIALLIWMPVLWWNWQHDWISFNFQIHKGFEADTTHWVIRLLTYVGTQAIVVSPILWLALVWYSLRGIGKVLHDPVRLYLTLMAWPVILFFAWSSVYGSQAQANWPAPAYFAGVMLAWAVLRGQLAEQAANPRMASIIIIVSLTLNLGLRLHLLYPWLPIAPQLDRSYEFAGWSNLGRQIRDIIDNHTSARGWFLLSDRGTLLAEALYYTNRDLIGFDPIRPERYVFLTDLNKQFQDQNAVIITREPTVAVKRFGYLFRNLTALGTYEHRYRDQVIKRMNAYLYLGEGFIPQPSLP